MLHPERRVQTDRRNKHTSPLTFSSLTGSRQHLRRVDDRASARYVDRYGTRSVFTVLFIVALSVTDATFTLKLVSLGAQELNPVMDFFLQYGPIPFLVAKYLITGSCLVWFLVHKNFSIWGGSVSVKSILITVLVMYGALIFYELLLLNLSGG
jgi:hypothetical protein